VPGPFLQAHQLHPGQLRQRRKLLQRNGALPIASIGGTALPGDADLERRAGAELRVPGGAERGIGEEVGT